MFSSKLSHQFRADKACAKPPALSGWSTCPSPSAESVRREAGWPHLVQLARMVQRIAHMLETTTP
jgi:hypothetical protein